MVLICLQGDTVRFKAFRSYLHYNVSWLSGRTDNHQAFAPKQAKCIICETPFVLGKKLFLSVIAKGVYLLFSTSLLSRFLLLPKPVYPKSDFLSHPADLTNITDG